MGVKLIWHSPPWAVSKYTSSLFFIFHYFPLLFPFAVSPQVSAGFSIFRGDFWVSRNKKTPPLLFWSGGASVSKKYADCTAPKPPLCKGRWHGEAVTEGLTQQKVTYSPILSAKS